MRRNCEFAIRINFVTRSYRNYNCGLCGLCGYETHLKNTFLPLATRLGLQCAITNYSDLDHF